MKIKSGILLSIDKRKDVKRGLCIIPDYATRIGEWAFYNCSNLTSVTIPHNVISIGNHAFFGCENLTNITVDVNNQNYKSIDGNLYSKDGKILIQYAIGKTVTSFAIPDGVTSIGSSAFSSCSSLTSIEISSSVNSIGYLAFSGCKNLTSVKFEENSQLTSIGEDAFSSCSNLERLIIPKTINKIKCVKGFFREGNKLKCRDFIYEIGKTYKESVARLCESGFHACTLGLDVFNYYAGDDRAYYEVELSDISFERGDDSKICGTTITLLRELTVAEVANYRSEIVE